MRQSSFSNTAARLLIGVCLIISTTTLPARADFVSGNLSKECDDTHNIELQTKGSAQTMPADRTIWGAVDFAGAITSLCIESSATQTAPQYIVPLTEKGHSISVSIHPDSQKLTWVDINFDGHLDFGILATAGATGNTMTWYWLFEPTTDTFISAPEAFDRLFNATFDANTKSISEYGSGAGGCGISTYVVVAGEPKLQQMNELMPCELDEPGTHFCHTITTYDVTTGEKLDFRNALPSEKKPCYIGSSN